MSDTPRTDAHLADSVRLTSLYSAHPDFARELERENAALRARLAEVEDERNRLRECSDFNELQCQNALANLARAERDRDEARKAGVDYCMEIDRIMKERDAARADNTRLRAVLERIKLYRAYNGDTWPSDQARSALEGGAK